MEDTPPHPSHSAGPGDRAEDDPGEIPLADAAPEIPRSLRQVSAGHFKCDSCDGIFALSQLHRVENRQFCFECLAARNRAAAREESRMADAEKSASFLTVSNSLAATLVVTVPAAGWLLLMAGAQLLLGSRLPFETANNLSLVNFIITALFFVSMMATGKIFGGYDLPSLPNRLWKMLALVTFDTLLFMLAIFVAPYLPCMVLVYFFAGRTLVYVAGLMIFFGLELVEAVLTTIFVWLALCIGLMNDATRAILIPV